MDIFLEFLANKKTMFIIVIAFVVLTIISFIVIWKPEDVLTISKYEPYDEKKHQEYMATYYFNWLSDLKMYGQAKNFKDSISEDYLEYTGKTAEELYSCLIDADVYFNVHDLTVTNLGSTVIYSGTVDTSEQPLRINIVEDYPYDVRLTFDDFISMSNVKKSGETSDLEVNVVSTIKKLNYIELVLEAVNNSGYKTTIDLSRTNKVYLTMSDGSKVYLNNSHSVPQLENMEKGTIAKTVLRFNVGIMAQSDIQKITLLSINVGGKACTLEIPF